MQFKDSEKTKTIISLKYIREAELVRSQGNGAEVRE